MIAMQYGFVFPADYDMTIIDRRIADKGHLTDGLPGLVFKAYLSSRKTEAQGPASENRYAPFYLWATSEGMNDFLSGPGFAGLTQSFGWPAVRTWSVWQARLTERLGEARFARRELLRIPAHAPLDAVRAEEQRLAEMLVVEQGALGAVTGFEPTRWSRVRFSLWAQLPPAASTPDQRVYAVGHVSR